MTLWEIFCVAVPVAAFVLLAWWAGNPPEDGRWP